VADERLRTVEREALSGDPAARARLLRERVRVGALTRERLALAASLGDEVARLAAPDEPLLPGGVASLLDALERWGREPLGRAALSAARAALPRWAALVADDPRPARALDDALAWLDAPDATRARALEAHLDAVQQLARAEPWDLAPPTDGDPALAPEAANAAVFAVRAARGAVWSVLWFAEGASLYSMANYARDALFDAAGAVGEAAVLEAVRADLVAWALGA
jgi:hypothetical protein